MLGLSCLLDRLMYGSWVLVPLNFLKFNFLSSGGDYYGTHKWHWYFSQGFLVMLFTFLPFSLAGSIKSKHWKLAGLIVWVLILYSILAHKEFRYSLHYGFCMPSCQRLVLKPQVLLNLKFNYELQVCLACASNSFDILWIFVSCDGKK